MDVITTRRLKKGFFIIIKILKEIFLYIFLKKNALCFFLLLFYADPHSKSKEKYQSICNWDEVIGFD